MPSSIHGDFGVAVVGLRELSRDLRNADRDTRRAVRELNYEFSRRTVAAAQSRARTSVGKHRFAELIQPIRSLRTAGIRYPKQGGGTPSRRGRTPAMGWLMGSKQGRYKKQFARYQGKGSIEQLFGAAVTSLLGSIAGKTGVAYGRQMMTSGDVSKVFPKTYAVTPGIADVAPQFGQEYERRLRQTLRRVWPDA